MRARLLHYAAVAGKAADHSDSDYRGNRLSGHTPRDRIYSPTPL